MFENIITKIITMSKQIKTKNLPCNENPDGCSFKFADYKASEAFSIYHATMNYLIYCEKGSVRISSNLFKDEIIHEGELMFLPRISDYIGQSIEDTHFIIHLFNHAVCQPENCILSYLYTHRNRKNENLQYQCLLTCNQGIHTFMNSITNYINDDTGDVFLWNLKHKELIRMLCRYYPPTTLQSFFHPLTDEDVPFKSLVLSHYQKIKTAKELAELCGYSIETFRRLFNAEFHVPIYQWLQKKKAEQVLFRLSIPHVSIKEIIEELNFTSPQQFNQFCKINLGDTPGRLQAKLQNQE